MSGRGRGRGPAFSGRTGGHRITSLQARDASFGGRGGRGKFKKTLNGNYMSGRDNAGPGSSMSKEESNVKLMQTKAEDTLEATLGFPLFTSGPEKLGWLMNMQASSMEDKDSGHVASAVDCYFMCQDGSMFKARMPFAPYFYIQVRDGCEADAEGFLRRKFDGLVKEIEIVEREDLDLKNHLSGLTRKLLKLSFWNVQQLMEVRREVAPAVAANQARAKTTQAYTDMALLNPAAGGAAGTKDMMDVLMDMREYDVPYHIRFAIDKDIRCGHWFHVTCQDGVTSMTRDKELLQRAEPRICAWDIETTKLPLQFPNAEYDQVFMISYMIDKQGYLITNREVVGGDITDFEFTPKAEYEGPFTIFNEPNELALLQRFFSHMREVKPAIYVTYNGDFFDYPFMIKRAAVHGMDLYEELGFKTSASGEVLARHAVHMDCLHWVNRDSYLPQGSRGLKAVTKAKLGYDPVEVDPEDMLKMAAESPQAMASYSVSDAVSTYYLYMTYIHPFIFSLATIIPMPPDEVLRKGSGTLCEQLLMVEAYKKSIACPNKHTSESEVFYKGHLLSSETYIGGKVEAIESGVFRADLPLRFRCNPTAYQQLIDRLDKDLGYAIEEEGKMKVEDIVNYDEVKAAITQQLAQLRDTPNREETPLIYHLDVAAMYPNIILTNRLQPSAIVNDEDCAACDFNMPDKTCLRQMEWVWRGEHFAASKNEYLSIKHQLQAEMFPPAAPPPGRPDKATGQPRTWDELTQEERDKLLQERLKKYTQKVYKRILDKPVTEHRMAGICQRENSFYVDTVRDFRDRRYEYKGKNKEWKGKLEKATAEGNPLKIQQASDMVVLYDSLQLAHKCILNSFYGYVMRKGARWYSMEMAGVVTYTGANIIQRANALVGQLGRPLELDTDGIWCALPASFPENFKFKNKSGKDLKISYPCVMLNVMVADHNTNPQYQTLDKATGAYTTTSEMSIEFEVDGPYKAMILPASKEEGKSIKKRYAVFNFDGSLAELKGFEIKRRGELKLIKVFQAEVFECFLAGATLQQCYAAVAAVANRWLDMLDTQGSDLTDEELISYISEATTMSKGLEEYEGRKSCPITCARRLGQFLGDERIKDKGLNCTYVIARKPENQPTSERAIPVSIFSAEPAVARTYLRQWCGDVGSAPSHCVPDVRDIVDWGYYKERLGSAIQKIITIPAAMQGVPNPCPRVKHPDWLQRKVAALSSRSHQQSLKDMLPVLHKRAAAAAAAAGKANRPDGGEVDMEDAVGLQLVPRQPCGTTPARDGSSTGPRGAGRRAGQQTIQVVDEGQQGNQENVAPNRTAAAGTGQGKQGQVEGVAAGPKPALADGYKDWMEYQKGQWRQGREARKRRRAEAAAAARAAGRDGTHAPLGRGVRDDVGRLLRQQAASITKVPWQVLQLADTHTPGMFKLWFLANGVVHSVHVSVPRVLYIDSELPLDEASVAAGAVAAAAAIGGASVQFTQGGHAHLGSQLQGVLSGLVNASCVKAGAKTLPGQRKAHNLYEVTLSEEQYLANAPILSAVLSAPHIRAVYEERLPLSTVAALTLGSVTALSTSAAAKPLNATFTLQDFQDVPSSTPDQPYLSAPTRQPGTAALLGQTRQTVRKTGADENQPLGPQLKHMVLYMSGDAAVVRGRAVTCLFQPSTGRCLVVVLQSAAAAAREVSQGQMERAWREIAATAPERHLPGPGRIDFSVEYCRDVIAMASVLQRALRMYRDEQRARAMVVVQSPTPSSVLAATWLRALSDWPCVDLPPHAADSQYPPLQWQLRAAKRALGSVVEATWQMSGYVEAARYAGIPLAHLSSDFMVGAADLQLARSLKAADHLLWMQDPATPDLGVEDKDDGDAQLSVLVSGLNAVVSDPAPAGSAAGGLQGLQAGATQPGTSPELLVPGAYRSVCVQLKLYHLAVAALMQSATLGDLEGAASVEGAGGPAGPAFKVLKGLVTTWLQDATVNLNTVADKLLQSLYRWVCSPGSALYDPALRRALQGIMSKMFAQLVSEMRKMGAVLVSANFNTIIIATGKQDIKAAAGYIAYLLQALKRRELFGWLDLQPQQWWHSLLYRDRYNWAGIDAYVPRELWDPSDTTAAKSGGHKAPGASMVSQAPPPLSEGLPATTPHKAQPAALDNPDAAAASGAASGGRRDRAGGKGGGDDEDESINGDGDGGGSDDVEEVEELPEGSELDGQLSYQWNLVTFLPPGLHEQTEDILNEFLYLPWKDARKAAARRAAAEQEAAAAGEGAEQQQGGGGAGGGEGDLQQQWLDRELPNSFTRRMLELVTETARVMPVGSEHPDHQFPQLAGSHLTQEELGSPALSFVRVTCHVLGLDTRCQDAVAVLRRQLLRLLHVREFSAGADFRELCLALTLPDVICSFCNDCSDLDLCRDAELAAQGASGAGWRCRSCNNAYNMADMEQRLVTALRHHIKEYELQDVQCVRCRAVASSHLGSTCVRCGGDLAGTIKPQTLRKRLTVFHSVAQHHGFPVLQQMAGWLLNT